MFAYVKKMQYLCAQYKQIACFMKRLTGIIITLLFAVSAFCAEPVRIDRLNYNLNETTRTAEVAYTPGTSGSISIPSSVEYKGVRYRVTNIESGAFGECENLLSVVIPEGITKINDYVFVQCYRLSSVTIPKSVTEIGAWAFNFCNGLTSVSLPEDVVHIGEGAFSGCTNLQFIAIPHQASIDRDAFWGCENIRVSFYDNN